MSSFQIVKLHNRIQRTNAYSVKKKYLFLESKQYGRKKNFSTVVLLYDESIFIDILKISTAKRQFLQESASNLPKSRAAVSVNSLVKENTISTESALLFVFTFDETSSPFLKFLDYSYWPVRDLELVLRDAANVHTGKNRLAV